MQTPAEPTQPSPGHVTVRYWASLRAAAGVAEDVIPVLGITTLADVKMTVLSAHRHSSQFAQLLEMCSVLVGDRPMNTGDPELVEIAPGAAVEFLPPFAGG